MSSPSLNVRARPWEIAKSRFLDGLSTEERNLFNSASLENLFYQSSGTFERYKIDSKLWRAQIKLQPLLDAFEEYGKALDVFANMSSLIMVPIWGSIRVILQMARNTEKYFGAIVEMFGRIGDALPRLRVYEELFPDHDRLLRVLANTYLEIIVFCIDTKSLFRNPNKDKRSSFTLNLSGKIFWRTQLEKKLEGLLASFVRHQKLVEKEAQLCNMIEAQKFQALTKANLLVQSASKEEAKRRMLLSALSSVNFAAQHRRRSSERHPGTCNWLLGDANFQSWLDADKSSCFAIYGIPGSGKSVLMASAVDAMTRKLQSPMSSISYFYCDYDDIGTLDTTAVLGTLTRQLLERHIPAEIETLLSSCCDDDSVWKPPPHVILNIFERSLCLFSNCVLVIDGVDELTHDHQVSLLAALRKAMSSDQVNVKVLVSARSEENDIRRALQGPNCDHIELSPTLLSSDLQVMIDDEVNTRISDGRLSLVNLELKTEIVQALSTGAKDMFLWVKFQLNDLCEAISDSQVRQILRDLPRDLGETYFRLISKIRGSKARFDTAQRMFKWILCARRPMYIEELREAISIDVGDLCLDYGKLPSVEDGRLMQCCGNLAVLNRSDGTVRLAHETVRQYLLGDSRWATPGRSVNGSAIAHLKELENYIGELCVTYLCFSDFDTQVAKYNRVTIAAGTDILETAVYSQQPVASAVGKFTRTLRRGWRETNIPRHPVTVAVLDTGRQASRQKYALLEYLVQNWTGHAAYLTPASKSWEQFKDIIFHRKYFFDVKPWESDCYRMASNHTHSQLSLFRWAIDEGFPAFLEIIDQKEKLAEDEAKDGEHPLIRASKANQATSFELCCKLGDEISNPSWVGSEMVLELCKVATIPMLRILSIYVADPTMILLSHNLLDACRDGNLELVKAFEALGVINHLGSERVLELCKVGTVAMLRVLSICIADHILILLYHDLLDASRDGNLQLVKAFEALGVISHAGQDLPFLCKVLFEAIQYHRLKVAEFLVDCQPLAIRSYENFKNLLDGTRSVSSLRFSHDEFLAEANNFLQRCWLSESDPLVHAHFMKSITQLDFDMFTWILEYGVDVNRRSDNQKYALLEAAKIADPLFVAFLLREHYPGDPLNLLVLDTDGTMLPHIENFWTLWTCSGSHSDPNFSVLQNHYSRTYPTWIEAQDEEGYTLLQKSILWGNLQLFQSLITATTNRTHLLSCLIFACNGFAEPFVRRFVKLEVEGRNLLLRWGNYYSYEDFNISRLTNLVITSFGNMEDTTVVYEKPPVQSLRLAKWLLTPSNAEWKKWRSALGLSWKQFGKDNGLYPDVLWMNVISGIKDDGTLPVLQQ